MRHSKMDMGTLTGRPNAKPLIFILEPNQCVMNWEEEVKNKTDFINLPGLYTAMQL